MIAPALRVALRVAGLLPRRRRPAPARGRWPVVRAVAGPRRSHGLGVIGSLPFDVVLPGGCAAGLLACSAWVPPAPRP